MIWTIFAVLTAAVIAFLLLPVIRAKPLPAGGDRNSYDRAVFRDQLAELERDLERGTIGPAEAEAARNEISRRLIAASEGSAKSGQQNLAGVALIAALLVPAVALPLYLQAGSPMLQDVPLAERMANAEKTGDFAALLVKVEQHLAKNPDDVEGWKVLAPAYRRSERWSDAAEAQRNILRLSTPDAQNLSEYGEALVLANQGLVSTDAHELFVKALAIDPKYPKARFYNALALKQVGKTAEAKAAFEAFLSETPADAPWRPMLLAEMKDLSRKPPALDAETMENATNMSASDQQAMIRGMVDGLEEELKADASDLEGWLRLIRARSVLGEMDKAKSAFETAKTTFKDDPQAIARLDGLAQEMNIQ
jgi:cytochrome c-type biogenesis protein CcmH